jgi:hypothetical protein
MYTLEVRIFSLIPIIEMMTMMISLFGKLGWTVGPSSGVRDAIETFSSFSSRDILVKGRMHPVYVDRFLKVLA